MPNPPANPPKRGLHLIELDLRNLRARREQKRLELGQVRRLLRLGTSGLDTKDQEIASLEREIASLDRLEKSLVAEQEAWH